MIRFAPFFLLLCLSFLLARPATAQPIKHPTPGPSPQREGIAPLAPVAVQLVPGDVIRERLVGLDSASYQASRHALELVPAADAVQADLRRENDLALQELATTKQALQECRAGRVATETDLQKMHAAATAGLAIAPRPPWLLDGHFYKGVGLGVVLAVLVKVFVFH